MVLLEVSKSQILTFSKSKLEEWGEGNLFFYHDFRMCLPCSALY